MVPETRDFLDFDTTRKNIYGNVLAGLQERFPIENEQFRLELGDLAYDGPDVPTKKEAKRAILERRSLVRPVTGTWRLVDKKTQQVVDETKGVVLRVPMLTERGTYVLGGNNYTLSNQARLHSGVYTRKKSNDELEAHFNVLKGGPSFRLYMEPASGVYRMQLGQSRMKMYPLLRAMGVQDKELADYLGPELTKANAAAGEDMATVKKAMAKLSRQRARKETGEMADPPSLSEIFAGIELDPRVTSKTLGKPYANVTPEVMLATMKKLAAINRGEADTDDRDSMVFQETYSAEDFFRERIAKDAGNTARRLLWKATLRKNLGGIGPAPLQKPIQMLFQGSGLAQPTEETNPLDVVDQNLRVTRMGEGGIPSDDVVPDEARSVQPSHFMFIDAVRSPECYHADMDVMTRRGWVRWPDVTDDEEFACLVDGVLVYRRASRVVREHYAGRMYGVRTRWLGYRVTPNHRLWVRPYNTERLKWRIETAEQTFMRPRYYMCGGHGAYSPTDPATAFTLPAIQRLSNHTRISDIPFKLEDWAEFLGWYLSEGNTKTDTKTSNYKAHISQQPGVFLEEIRALIAQLGFKGCLERRPGGAVHGVTIPGKQLWSYLRQFGLCTTKFIPEYMFEASPQCRKILMDTLLKGDGRKAYPAYCTTSRQLADDFVRLAFSLGYSTNTAFEPDGREERYLGCYVVRLHVHNDRIALGKRGTRTFKKCDYFTEDYDGMVYCATVPGGLLYVREHDRFGHWSGNSGRVGVDQRLAIRTKRGSDRNLYSPFIDRRGKEVMLTPEAVASAVVAFPGEMEIAAAQGGRKVAAMRGGKLTYVDRDEVDYVAPSGEDMFTLGSLMVPGIGGIKGNRLLMGGKFSGQSLPLVKPEAPFVTTAVPRNAEGRTYADVAGDYAGVARSKAGGIVEKVTKSEIWVRTPAGEVEKHELYDNFPLNRKTFLTNVPLVAPGQRVKPGGLVARSNYTDDSGRFATGRNLRVAYLPYKGHNFEDAIVLSKGAAEKLCSEHMFTRKLDQDSHTQVDPHKFQAIFHGKYTDDQLKRIGPDGTAIPGSTIHKGDPIILATEQRLIKGAGQQLYRGAKGRFSDASVVWEHDDPAVVTDVFKDKHGVNVALKATMGVRVGDKLCYDEATEVLTERGWVAVKDLVLDDRIASLDPVTGALEYVRPVALHRFEHSGEMYRLETTQVSLCVTRDHKLYAEKRGAGKYGLHSAGTLAGTRYRLKNNATWHGVDPDTVAIPGFDIRCGQHGHGVRRLPDMHMPLKTYLALLGAYLSEGSVVNRPSRRAAGGWIRKVSICQIKEHGVAAAAELQAMLAACGVRMSKANNGFCIYSAQLAAHLAQFGHSHDKFIPGWVFGCTSSALETLFDWLMWGDGHRGKTHDVYTTTSPRLADDVQRLCLHMGIAAKVNLTPARRGMIKGKEYAFSPRYDVFAYWHKNRPTINHGHVRTQGGQAEGWEHYDGYVYCPTLERNHVLYVRRNGKACWCGNSGRFGDKGVVGKILDDADMPQDENGRPLDIIVPALGVISRVNPSQVAEAMLGKIAAEKGKTYALPAFPKNNMIEFARDELRLHGLKSNEALYDPLSRRKIPDVFVGNRYYMKLHHMSEDKETSRALGSYSAEGEPSPSVGGPSPRRIGLGEVSALIGHGAVENLREIRTIKGQRNDDWWNAFMQGYPPPSPKIPGVYRKYMAGLQAAGVNVVKDGNYMNLSAMTDKDVEKLSRGEVENPKTVRWLSSYGREAFGEKSMDPEPGGLFDLGLTGGHHGNGWSHIQLDEPIPNPIMEGVVRRLLGLTQPKLESIVAGEEELGAHGTGGDAVRRALAAINVDEAIALQREKIKTAGSVTARADAVRRLKDLDGLKRTGVAPQDLMLTKIPVLPPLFRPITATNKFSAVAGVNELYQDLINSRNDLREIRKTFDGTPVAEARKTVYAAAKAVSGLGDPVKAERKTAQVRGILTDIFGSSPKLGTVQRRLIGTNVDMGGRSVITPNPSLNMDQIGIPEESAWELFSPYVARRLIKRYGGAKGARLEIMKQLKERSPTARQALIEEMQNGVVLASRAPVLHKYGVMAFRPMLSPTKTLQVSPQIVVGFNADFDGDSCVCSTFVVYTNVEAGYLLTNKGGGDNMPTTDKIVASAGIVHIADFPRVPGSEVVTGRGNIVYDVPPGIKTIAVRGDGRFELADVTKFSIHPKCEEWIVKTGRGRDLVVSQDHSLAVVDMDTLEVVRSAPRDAAGKCIPSLRGTTGVAVTEYKISDHKTNPHGGDTRKKIVLDTVPATREYGWFIGAMVGDGWVSKVAEGARIQHKGLCLASGAENADAVVAEWKRVAATIIEDAAFSDKEAPHEFEGAQCVSVKTTVCSAPVARAMETLIGSGAENKHLPEGFLFTPEEFRRGLFCGLLDTDGTVCWSKGNAKKKPQFSLSFTSVSERLIDEAVLLGQSLGIYGKKSGYQRRGHGNYIAVFSSADVFSARGWLRSLCPQKQAALDRLASGTAGGPKPGREDVVPMPSVVREAFLSKLSAAGATRRNGRDKAAFSAYVVLRKGEAAVTRETANGLLRLCDGSEEGLVAKWIELVSDPALSFDEIVEAKATGATKVMYDLTVPGPWTFLAANGLAVWDCMQFHVVTTDKAKEEALNKMLPSRNLLSAADFKPMYAPRQEFLQGLYLASTRKSGKPPRVFAFADDVEKAYRAGKIDIDDQVIIREV